MTDDREHERWDELAAGYVLDALEPEESTEYVTHLRGCARCEKLLPEHAFVAAQLGTLAELEGSAPSWESIQGVLPRRPPASLPVDLPPLPLLRRQQAEEPAAPVIDLASRRRRGTGLLAAAASLVLLGSAGVVAWEARGPHVPTRQEAILASCGHSPGCHVVQLQSKAKLVVTDGQAHLLAEGLPDLGPSQRYVLWQMPRTGRPTLLGMLQETSKGSIGEGHRLALPYDDTAAFGLSVERAQIIPLGPTKVVAVGTA